MSAGPLSSSGGEGQGEEAIRKLCPPPFVFRPLSAPASLEKPTTNSANLHPFADELAVLEVDNRNAVHARRLDCHFASFTKRFQDFRRARIEARLFSDTSQSFHRPFEHSQSS